MKLYYQGTDITKDVHVKKAHVLDYSGGKCDRVDILFDDTNHIWARWDPQLGDVLRIAEEEYRTGDLYVDEIQQEKGMFRLGAVSVPPALRNSGDRTWQHIRFSALIAEFAARASMPYRIYGLPEDPLYPGIRQEGQQDITWLANQCALESCMLKVTAGTLVVCYEPWLEARGEVSSLTLLEGSKYRLQRQSARVYAGCRVQAAYDGAYGIPGAQGPWLVARAGELGLPEIHSQGEAERYAKGILRAHNRWAFQGECRELPLQPHLAAGSLVALEAAGIAFPGKWVVDEAVHRLVIRKTMLKLRKPLEGY